MIQKINDIISSITSVLNIHLYLNQHFIINTSSVLFVLEKVLYSSISNRLKEHEINFSSNLNISNSTVLIRIMMQPLASYGNSSQLYTNFSRLFSLSFLDENQNDIRGKNFTNSIEFFIPRDPNLLIPSMFFQNVTILNEKNLLFHFYSFNLTQTNGNLTYSIHFEIEPLNTNISYLLIYEFDHKLRLN